MDRKVMPKILLYIIIVSLAFIAGRGSVSTQAEGKVIVKTEWKDRVQVEWRDRIVEKIVYVKAEAKNSRTESRETVRPDGTVERERIETQSEQVLTTSDKDLVVDRTSTRVEDHKGSSTSITEIKSNQSDWNISVLAGASLNSGPLLPPWVAGLHVQRRILGPVSVGAWGLTNASIGISVGLEF